MKVAVIGSRSIINVEISKFIPEGTTEIVSGGATGIDTLAEKWADNHKMSKTIVRPEYSKYGRKAPLIRNREIVKRADVIVAIWDGKSSGTKFTIDYAKEVGKEVRLYMKR